MSDHAVTIRPVTQTDAAQVRENCYSMNTLEQIQGLIEANLQKTTQGNLIQLVAELDGQVIGTAILERRAHPLMTHRAEIAGLVVHPDYHGRGIARQLVEGCRTYALTMDITILEISCRGGEPAEKVYPNLGFIEYGRLPRAIIEPWGEHNVFDEVLFFQSLE